MAALEAVEMAFQGLGGVTALTRWARENPTDFYKLWARRIPNAIDAQHSGGVTLTVTVRDE